MAQTVVQISDTHISVDVPSRLEDLGRCIAAINALDTPPELVIHTGDVAHDGLREEYHSARELLDQLDAPYVVMPGNRDNRSALREVFLDDRYTGIDLQWIQYSIETFSTRLVMCDTVSDQSNKGRLCPERLSHLQQMLDADLTKPVALFLHHPPYPATGIPDPYQYERWDDCDALATLLQNHNQLSGIYCGHVHRFIEGEVGGLAASAITCLAGDLRKGEVSDEERQQPVFKVISL